MGFAKQPDQAPQFDATALMAALKAPAVLAKQFIGWKRWAEASNEHDGTGLRDVVAANAHGMDSFKADYDAYHSLSSQQITDLTARVAALEARPQVPFPASS